MMSVNTYTPFQAGNVSRGQFFSAVSLVFLLIFLPAFANGQSADFLRVDGEEPIFALHRSDSALETPAEAPQFVIIRRAEISRIITLHRKGEASAEAGTITLLNLNGDFKIGTWIVEEEAVSGNENLVYWVVYPDKGIPPGRYQIIDSVPATWVNSAGTNREGMSWVFSKLEVSM